MMRKWIQYVGGQIDRERSPPDAKYKVVDENLYYFMKGTKYAYGIVISLYHTSSTMSIQNYDSRGTDTMRKKKKMAEFLKNIMEPLTQNENFLSLSAASQNVAKFVCDSVQRK